MNYTELTNQIKEYNRTDSFFTSNIPNFIKQGVERIYSEAKNIGFETVFEGTLEAGTNNIPKDTHWRETVSLELTEKDNSTVSVFMVASL